MPATFPFSWTWNHSVPSWPRATTATAARDRRRAEEHTSELQSRGHLVCRLLLEKKKQVHTHMLITSAAPTRVSPILSYDTVPTELYSLSLHDALPILAGRLAGAAGQQRFCAVHECRRLFHSAGPGITPSHRGPGQRRLQPQGTGGGQCLVLLFSQPPAGTRQRSHRRGKNTGCRPGLAGPRVGFEPAGRGPERLGLVFAAAG